MRIHILGICGTFMAGIAQLAREFGHEVTGSDLNVYPPMSTQLQASGIQLREGYEPSHIDPKVDFVIVGNVISRGNPAMEYVLNQKIPYQSGPQWLAENILRDRWVLAVSGTHGKTTTTSMLTWILEAAGKNPGFLIGGVPENFGISARSGKSPYFVIEADEYDSAFFDKRSKFIHYGPKTLILNNLEYDHADIFPNLEAIKQQFQFMIRTVPGNGLIIQNALEPNLVDVLAKGCWTKISTFAGTEADWQAKLSRPDGSEFEVYYKKELVGVVEWQLLGQHNVNNALAALSAAHHAGVRPSEATASLSSFKNVKRRLEVKGQVKNITVYDDFAHHPTAIATTLAGLRAKIGNARIVAILEFGSNTMKMGVHKESIEDSLSLADVVICKEPDNAKWNLQETLKHFKQSTAIYKTVDELVQKSVPTFKQGDHVVVMSNGGFDGIHNKLLKALQEGA